MKNSSRSNLPPWLIAASLTMMLMLTAQNSMAQHGSATWDLNPGSGNWGNPANWTPMTVPNGPSDTATFGNSNSLSVSERRISILMTG